MVDNPTYNFRKYSEKSDSKQVHLSKKEENHRDYAFNKIFSIIICIALIVSIYLHLFGLYPFWLIAAILASISLGSKSFISSLSKKVSNNSIPSHIQLKKKKENQVPMRLPHREKELYRWLQGKILQPYSQSDAPEGVSEKDFYQLSKRVFPNIVQGIAFQNPKFPHPYSADFLIVHTSGLSIDIEIDEPYVGNTKAPHHCIDQGKDHIRNQFFTNNNWVVIRFSEKQVVKYPYRCCKVIAQVIAKVSGDCTFGRKLKEMPPLPSEPMWTIKQAKKWAKENYRKTYLP